MRHVALITLFIFFPAFAHAVALININTADATLLDTLPHIGAATAQKIIDYRTANGPFQMIGDIRKASTYISLNYFVDIAPLITVGETSATDVSDVTSDETASSTPTDTSTDTNNTTKTTYIPPPSALTVDAGGNQDATMEVPLHFSARAAIKSGTADSSAKIAWGFGDGSGAEGTAVEKTYSYAGTYLVVVTATDGVATGRDEFTVIVRPGQVHILGIRGTGVMITNDASERLDLSGWALFAGTHSFRIPNGTILLPKTSVLFSSAITKLVMEQEVTLAYPGGDIASRYASSPEPVEQLSSAPVSSNQVQTVEPIINPKTNVQSYDKAVIAPAATPDTGVAAGAAIPAPIASPTLAAVATAPEASKTPATGLFHSVWTLGLLGIMALAGGAFILL